MGVPGTPNSNGVNRQVVRYEFEPVGGTAEDIFFIYVSHMKSSSSGDESVNETDRNNEALLIRQDAATLPATASILYMGDFNIGAPTEAAYGTLTGAGQGQAIDPLVWSSPTPRALMSESSTDLRYRDDIQFMTANVASDAPVAGLHYLAGSFRVFGNNGTTSIGGSVNSSKNSALDNLVGPITASSALPRVGHRERPPSGGGGLHRPYALPSVAATKFHAAAAERSVNQRQPRRSRSRRV